MKHPAKYLSQIFLELCTHLERSLGSVRNHLRDLNEHFLKTYPHQMILYSHLNHMWSDTCGDIQFVPKNCFLKVSASNGKNN